METEGVLPGLYFLDNFGGSLALLWCGIHNCDTVNVPARHMVASISYNDMNACM